MTEEIRTITGQIEEATTVGAAKLAYRAARDAHRAGRLTRPDALALMQSANRRVAELTDWSTLGLDGDIGDVAGCDGRDGTGH